jgi:hypothetical protein
MASPVLAAPTRAHLDWAKKRFDFSRLRLGATGRGHAPGIGSVGIGPEFGPE